MPILLQRGARLDAQAAAVVEDLKSQGYVPEYNSSHTAYRWVNGKTGEPYTGSTYGGVPVTRQGLFLKKRGLRRRIGSRVGDEYAAGNFGEPAYKQVDETPITEVKTKGAEDAAVEGEKKAPATQQTGSPMQFPPIILGPKWGDNVPKGKQSLAPKPGTEKKTEETKPKQETTEDKSDNVSDEQTDGTNAGELNKWGVTPQEQMDIEMGYMLPDRYKTDFDLWSPSFNEGRGKHAYGRLFDFLYTLQRGAGQVLGIDEVYHRGTFNEARQNNPYAISGVTEEEKKIYADKRNAELGINTTN